ncbi:hypothetical protein [Bacillus marinisedimentorum]|uniref:hypothetical protein n=1 Tax=Bacillus marinisedimentorum TaxID=1821260 RepID=UPI0007DF5EB3|nr:hypothetical protein [Bacillus marinisedimentorum]
MKLRIPLLILCFGLIDLLIQLVSGKSVNMFEGNMLLSLLHLAGVLAVFVILEKTGVNEKDVSQAAGIAIIAGAIIFSLAL